MTFFPRHPILRVVATAWLLASVVMLIVTLARPEIGLNERAALSSLVPLYFSASLSGTSACWHSTGSRWSSTLRPT